MSSQLEDLLFEAESFLDSGSRNFSNANSLIQDLKRYQSDSRVPPLLARLRLRRNPHNAPPVIVTTMSGRPLGSSAAGAPVGPPANLNDEENNDDPLSMKVLEAELLLGTSSQVYNEFDTMIDELKPHVADPRVPPLLERLRARRARLPMPHRNIRVTNMNGRPLPRRIGGKQKRKTKKSKKAKKQTRRRKN
jgi:hypothetical protein